MKRFVIGCIALACVVSGCGSSKDAGPAPVTSTMGTPTAASKTAGSTISTPAPKPSVDSQTPRAAESDVAEAQQVFQQYEDAYQHWQVAGGSAVLPADLSPLMADPLRLDVQQLLADQKLSGWRMAPSPKPRVVILGVLPTTKEGALVTLSTCVDATSIRVIGGKQGEHGVAMMYRSYFKRVEGTMKYFDVDHKRVARC